LAAAGEPKKALLAYPKLFRRSLEANNRMCLCGFMAAEYDDLPDAVKTEVQTFAGVNVAWLTSMLSSAFVSEGHCETKARAIFATVGGAQLMARSRADVGLFDEVISSFREAGLIPALEALRPKRARARARVQYVGEP
jgi:TetR/AcrR family transcriptional repressor of nem operon